MSDLISRADALAFPIRIDHYDREHGDLHFVLGIETVMEYIENLPSAEVVLQTPQTYGKSINPSNSEVVSDYISRQWLLDLYDTPKDGEGVDWKVPLEVVRQNIKDAPSAEAVPLCDDCTRCTVKALNRPSADADWKRRVMMYIADLQLSCDPHTEIGKAKWEALETAFQGIADMQSAEAVQGDGKMIPIELKKRYPHSRDEDITDAFMRGYKSAQAVQGEWVEEDEYGDLWVCDQCGFANEYMIKFCPICGAKMTKGGDDE